MSPKIWVLTTTYNEYDQHGDYLIAVFLKKPDASILRKILSPKVRGETIERRISDLLESGINTRLDYEDFWFNLTEIYEGEEYGHNS
jgi:hypothetical protein